MRTHRDHADCKSASNTPQSEPSLARRLARLWRLSTAAYGSLGEDNQRHVPKAPRAGGDILDLFFRGWVSLFKNEGLNMSGLMQEYDLALGGFRRKLSAKEAKVHAEHLGQVPFGGDTHQTQARGPGIDLKIKSAPNTRVGGNSLYLFIRVRSRCEHHSLDFVWKAMGKPGGESSQEAVILDSARSQRPCTGGTRYPGEDVNRHI
jgi:hypothetical protein